MGHSNVRRTLGKPEQRIRAILPKWEGSTVHLEGRCRPLVHGYALLAGGAGILPNPRVGAVVTDKLLRHLTGRILQLFNVSAADLPASSWWIHGTTEAVAGKVTQSLTPKRCERISKWLLHGTRAAGILRFAPIIGLAIAPVTQALTIEIVGLKLIGDCRKISRDKNFRVTAKLAQCT